MALTPKQRRFVDEYLVDGNATQAAIRAGYSEKSAYSQAHDLLKKPEIDAAIKASRHAQSERTQVRADRVLEELAAVAFADIRDFVAFGGSTVLLKPSPDLGSAAAVASVSGDGSKVSIRLHDKLRALELLMRHLGMLKEKFEVEHSGLAEMFDRLWERARDRQGEVEG